MTTNFNVISGETVPKNYSWDFGTPLTTTPTYEKIETVTGVISGYAPGLRVTFLSDVRNLLQTTSRVNVISSEYIWNFGDYYNDISNEISLQCPNTFVEHVYIMPGIYEVSLTTAVARELIPDPVITPRCYGKYRQGWYWNAVTCDTQTATTWLDTECDSLTKPKYWINEDNCFGEYCLYWSWWTVDKEGTGALNPIRWFQTRRAEEFTKKWSLGLNTESCDIELKSTFDVVEQTTVKQIVVVQEIPPVANIAVTSKNTKGNSPLEIMLSPKHIRCGSFPIDKIVWDFGDETSPITITRNSTPTDPNIIFTNTFFDDPRDPRNYDIRHTFKRTRANYSMFYPSLTCYSANTNTHDSCSITIGPVLLEPSKADYKLITASLNDSGILYSIDSDNSINFLTPSENLTLIETINSPNNILKFITDSQVRYFGYSGEDYINQYISKCNAPFAPRLVLDFLIQEETQSNNILYSEQFNNPVWIASNITITPDSAVAPNNSTTAETIVASGTGIINQATTKLPISTTYTASLYVKGSVTSFTLTVDDGNTVNRGRGVFNLSNGTLIAVYNDGNFTSTSGTISLLTNGWYRLTVTTTTNTATTARLRFFWANDTIEVWGAQLEVGSAVTNYIQTLNTLSTPILLEDETLIYK